MKERRGKVPPVRNRMKKEDKEEKRIGRKKMRKTRRDGSRGRWSMRSLGEEDEEEK